jgi:hypothetical protein
MRRSCKLIEGAVPLQLLTAIRDNGLELQRTLERFESTLLSDETAVSFVEKSAATWGSFPDKISRSPN